MLSMLALLEEELGAVQAREGKRLVDVAKQKEALLNQITAQDGQFADEANSALIASNPELKALRDEITQLLKDCQQKNEVVYLSATQNQVAIEEVKRLLIGGSKNTTYDAYGQKRSGGQLGKGIKA